MWCHNVDFVELCIIVYGVVALHHAGVILFLHIRTFCTSEQRSVSQSPDKELLLKSMHCTIAIILICASHLSLNKCVERKFEIAARTLQVS